MPEKNEQKPASVQPDIPMMAGAGRPGMMNRGRAVVKPKNFKATMRRLWHYVGSERKLLMIVFMFVVIDSALTLSAPYLIGVSVDTMTSGSAGTVNFKLLEMVIIALIAAYVADALLTFLQGWLMAGISQRIVMKLRTALFEKLQKLPLAYFDSRRHGEIMSRLSNDIENVSSSLSQSITQLMGGSIAIIGSLVMMLILSPLLTLASMITVPLVYLLARTITKRTSVLFKDQQVQLGKLNGHVEETISGIEVVKAFNREDKAIEEFDAVNAKLCEVGLKAQIWSGF